MDATPKARRPRANTATPSPPTRKRLVRETLVEKPQKQTPSKCQKVQVAQTTQKDRKAPVVETPQKPSKASKPQQPDATPTRKRRLAEDVALTPPKVKKVNSEVLMDSKTSKLSEVDVETQSVLQRLFQEVEMVLQLRASRSRLTSLEVVKESVVASCGKDLTTARLQQILALSQGMLSVRWVGQNKPYLTVEQQERGQVVRPEGSELGLRRQRFAEALAAAVKLGALPEQPLPQLEVKEKVRLEPPVDPRAGEAAAAKLQELAQLPRLGMGSCEERMAAVRARIMAKKEIVEKEKRQQQHFQELLNSMSACEDALCARELLLHLFARSEDKEGKLARVSEAKLLQTLSSNSTEQCTRLLSIEAARVALVELRGLGEGTWFTVTPAQHSKDSFWQRLPGGHDEALRSSLNSKMRRLSAEKQSLVSSGALVRL